MTLVIAVACALVLAPVFASVADGRARAFGAVLIGTAALAAAIAACVVQPARDISFALPIIGGGGFAISPLSTLFIVVTAGVFIVSLPFIASDGRTLSHRRNATLFGLVALTFAAMTGVFCAKDVVSFIISWEIAAWAIWGLIGFETRSHEPVAAGMLTLALSEIGSLAGLVGLLLLALGAGSMTFSGIATAVPHLPPATVAVAWGLTFFGFGMKAGIVPLNLWLPVAHANAPRSISPILSGATLNLGLFTFLRISSPLAQSNVWLGLIMLATGAITALVGVMYAVQERDMKRLLAQSFIENIGIVTAAFGAGLAFAALGKVTPAGICLIAGLYHLINHSTFKSLLFLGAAGIDDATGTHNLDRLGGLMKRLPLFGTLFLIGTIAIAALPPFNGYASEWLTLESLLRVVEVKPIPVRIIFGLSGAALALTAGLALTCFILLAGTTLLGLPRSEAARRPGRMSRTVTWPMAVLALACILLGILETVIIPVLGRLAAPIAGVDATSALVPDFFGSVKLPATVLASLTPMGVDVGSWLPVRGLAVLHSGGAATPVVFAMSTALTALFIVFIVAIVWFLTRSLSRRRAASRAPLWGAGLARLRPEMTYNATAFASPVRVLFNSVFRPVVTSEQRHQGEFVTAWHYDVYTTQIIERLIIRPFATAAKTVARLLASLHHGPVTDYAGYIVVTLLVTLLISRVLL